VEGCQENLLAWQCIRTAKKVILGSWLPSKSSFLGSLLLADFAWQLAAKDNYLGGFPIFLGGFWPPRQFHFLVTNTLALQIKFMCSV